MKKCKCGKNNWEVDIREDCETCEYGGENVFEDGECEMGSTDGDGCFFLTCTHCKSLDNIPIIER